MNPRDTQSLVHILHWYIPYYPDILNKITIGSFAIGVILMVLVTLIRKWMGDVR